MTYLPQELWDLIYDFKYDLEERDRKIKFKKDLKQLIKNYERMVFGCAGLSNYPLWMIKDEIRAINKTAEYKRIKLSQNKPQLIMEIINIDAKDMGLLTVKYEQGYAVIFNNEPYYFKDFSDLNYFKRFL